MGLIIAEEKQKLSPLHPKYNKEEKANLILSLAILIDLAILSLCQLQIALKFLFKVSGTNSIVRILTGFVLLFCQNGKCCAGTATAS